MNGPFLVSRLSFLVLATAAACDPGTTRPDLIPLPEARTFEVSVERPAAIEALHQGLVRDSFPVSRVDARDAWLETPWFDAGSLAPVGNGRLGAGVVKLRGWADPSRPGNAILVVELVYRPMADPSVPPRDLERAVLVSDSIYVRVGRVLKGIQDSIGVRGQGKTRE